MNYISIFPGAKSVRRAYFAKELPLTECVLLFPCGIMLSLSAPSFKEHSLAASDAFRSEKKKKKKKKKEFPMSFIYSNLNTE